MMEEIATVVANNNDGWVVVEVAVKSACSHCQSEENCGTSAISKAFTPSVQRFSVQTSQYYQLGEQLKLGLPESVLLKAAAIVYLLPLLGGFIGAFGGLFGARLIGLQSGDGLVIITTLIGGLLAWTVGRQWAKKLESNAQVTIIARLGRAVS